MRMPRGQGRRPTRNHLQASAKLYRHAASPNKNQQAMTRYVREPFGLLAWAGTATQGPGGSLAERSVLGRLTPANQAHNSSRGITPGLVNPAQGPTSTRIQFRYRQRFAPGGSVVARDGNVAAVAVDSNAAPPLVAGPYLGSSTAFGVSPTPATAPAAGGSGHGGSSASQGGVGQGGGPSHFTINPAYHGHGSGHIMAFVPSTAPATSGPETAPGIGVGGLHGQQMQPPSATHGSAFVQPPSVNQWTGYHVVPGPYQHPGIGQPRTISSSFIPNTAHPPALTASPSVSRPPTHHQQDISQQLSISPSFTLNTAPPSAFAAPPSVTRPPTHHYHQAYLSGQQAQPSNAQARLSGLQAGLFDSRDRVFNTSVQAFNAQAQVHSIHSHDQIACTYQPQSAQTLTEWEEEEETEDMLEYLEDGQAFSYDSVNNDTQIDDSIEADNSIEADDSIEADETIEADDNTEVDDNSLPISETGKKNEEDTDHDDSDSMEGLSTEEESVIYLGEWVRDDTETLTGDVVPTGEDSPMDQAVSPETPPPSSPSSSASDLTGYDSSEELEFDLIDRIYRHGPDVIEDRRCL